MSDSRIFISSDGHRLAYNLWLPEKKDNIKAFVQILHGMAEYSDRYEQFAKYLNKLGFAVFAADHRGHGHTAEEGELGWFAESNGWNRIASDAFEIASYVTKQYHAKQVFLFGHSMGSFLARTVMVQHPDFYSGVVIMGTGCAGLIVSLGKIVAKMQVNKYGQKAPGETMDKMSFGAYNKMIENPRTKFDWLSRDAKEVDKYIKDPLCGFLCTNGFFYDMLTGILFANNRANAKTLPKDLPLLIISGDKDPVGAYGKGVEKVYNLYRNAGISDVTMKLFADGRHELLNELNKKEVYDYIGSWYAEHC